MVHVRGARSDYGEWVGLGAEGWGWDDVLPIFVRMEDFDGGVSELHGVGGATSIISRYALAPVHEAIIAASREVGIARNEDYNSGYLDGVAQVQLTIRDGVRDSAAAAYLRPVIDAPNLRVVTRATARGLVFEGSRCVGVEWEHSGRPYTARAGSEVVISAGAIASPKLLLLSGIGPAPELAEHGIRVVLDLPGVGRNLHDHLLSPSIHAAERTIDPPAPGLPSIQTHLWWRSRSNLPGPDTQPVHFSVPLYEPWMEGPPNGFTLLGGMVRPQSRGSIQLSGPDLEDPLLIDLNVFEVPADLESLEASLTQVREIAAAGAARRVGRSRALSRARCAHARAGAGLCAPHRDHLPPPGRDLPDGGRPRRRRRPAPARARDRRVAGGRCIGHAGRHIRQHQRPNPHDRRARRRLHHRRISERGTLLARRSPRPAGLPPRIAGAECSALVAASRAVCGGRPLQEAMAPKTSHLWRVTIRTIGRGA